MVQANSTSTLESQGKRLPDVTIRIVKKVNLQFNKQSYTEGQTVTIKPTDIESLKKVSELLSSKDPCIEVVLGLEAKAEQPAQTAEQILTDIAKKQSVAASAKDATTQDVTTQDKTKK